MAVAVSAGKLTGPVAWELEVRAMRTVRLLTLGLGFCHVNCERFPQFIIHLLTVFFPLLSAS